MIDRSTRPHFGPIVAPTGGRADRVQINVAPGSFVLPADFVSAMGDGNTLAGHKQIDRIYGSAGQSFANGGVARLIPIKAAGGEHILSPDQVEKHGGRKALVQDVKEVRTGNIERLRGLPPPKHGGAHFDDGGDDSSDDSADTGESDGVDDGFDDTGESSHDGIDAQGNEADANQDGINDVTGDAVGHDAGVSDLDPSEFGLDPAWENTGPGPSIGTPDNKDDPYEAYAQAPMALPEVTVSAPHGVAGRGEATGPDSPGYSAYDPTGQEVGFDPQDAAVGINPGNIGSPLENFTGFPDTAFFPQVQFKDPLSFDSRGGQGNFFDPVAFGKDTTQPGVAPLSFPARSGNNTAFDPSTFYGRQEGIDRIDFPADPFGKPEVETFKDVNPVGPGVGPGTGPGVGPDGPGQGPGATTTSPAATTYAPENQFDNLSQMIGRGDSIEGLPTVDNSGGGQRPSLPGSSTQIEPMGPPAPLSQFDRLAQMVSRGQSIDGLPTMARGGMAGFALGGGIPDLFGLGTGGINTPNMQPPPPPSYPGMQPSTPSGFNVPRMPGAPPPPPAPGINTPNMQSYSPGPLLPPTPAPAGVGPGGINTPNTPASTDDPSMPGYGPALNDIPATGNFKMGSDGKVHQATGFARGGAVPAKSSLASQHMAAARLLFAKSKGSKNPQPFLKAAAQFKVLAREAAKGGKVQRQRPAKGNRQLPAMRHVAGATRGTSVGNKKEQFGADDLDRLPKSAAPVSAEPMTPGVPAGGPPTEPMGMPGSGLAEQPSMPMLAKRKK